MKNLNTLESVANHLNEKYNLNMVSTTVEETETIYYDGTNAVSQIEENKYIIECPEVENIPTSNSTTSLFGTAKVIDGKLMFLVDVDTQERIEI